MWQLETAVVGDVQAGLVQASGKAVVGTDSWFSSLIVLSWKMSYKQEVNYIPLVIKFIDLVAQRA